MKPGDAIMHGGVLCTEEDRTEMATLAPGSVSCMIDLHSGGIHTDEDSPHNKVAE